VGPAIAVFWGWLPALVWVLIGSVFIGAVHDFGSLVVSLRQRGQTIGDIAGRMISSRARLLFLLILFFCLVVVIGIFGLVIAVIFATYPETVLSTWVAMPVAVIIGWYIYKRGGHLLVPSILGLLVLYAATVVGVEWLPIKLNIHAAGPDASYFAQLWNPVVIWTVILLIYCFIASVLPVWLLLQPRDYINSHQLLVTLALLLVGLVIARPDFIAPAVNASPPGDSPAIFPFLFITIACGAVSGFHCLVSSGTSSKQLRRETDAQFVGYGSMLLEGGLAVLVIIACCAGIGLGFESNGTLLTGQAAWEAHYGTSWNAMNLTRMVGAFVDGGANMIAAMGIPLNLAVGIIAVMVCCFAATTLDTATRLQRYVIQEIGGTLKINVLKNKYWATGVAVATGGALALIPGPLGPGSGGLILWPLFGATNQLLAGLAFLVIIFFLLRHGKPVGFAVIPAALMIVIPGWAMIDQIGGWLKDGSWLLVGFGISVEILQVWMVIEAVLMWSRAKGVLPEPLPPLSTATATGGAVNEGGRSC
jgi:carbon starvation protein